MATVLRFTLVAPRLLHAPTVLFAGGAWGVAPDVHWVLPTGSSVVRSFHMTPCANVFWFHHYLDRVDPTDSREFAAALVVALVFVVAACELVTRLRVTSPALSSVESGHE